MKKIIFLLSLLLFPLAVLADGTDKYYIEANILSNGDMEVKELKILSGSYNGIETTLKYKNNNLIHFTGIQNDFDGSDIYNASNLENIKVYGVKYSDKNNFDIINSTNKTEFKSVGYANKGEYGVYTTDFSNNYLVYMPSTYNEASLITYTLKDVVVIHNDIAEIAWDFVGFDYKEQISNLIIVINLPGSSEELRVFSHGPLSGSNEIVNDQQVKAIYNKLPANKAIDVRVVFDKDLVSLGTKISNVDGLENILAVEKIRAEKANENRAGKFITIGIIWGIVLLVVFIYYYLKYDKELKKTFPSKYYREFIEDYNVEVIDYLMKKQITSNAMSASILNLIYKKNIKVDKQKTIKNKDEYLFTKLMDSGNETEQMLITFLFNKVGNGTVFSDGMLKDYAKSEKTYTDFLSSFTRWKNAVVQEGQKQKFWQEGKQKVIYGAYIIISAILLYFNYLLTAKYLSDPMAQMVLTILIAAHIIFFIYVISSKKRTQYGHEHYQRWSGFKNFLNDFGAFEQKDLPEIILWERYLVYATIFGLADKVQKTMNVKIKEYNYDQTMAPNVYNYMIFNNIINNAVKQAGQTATKVAASQASSSGGFGGGSSFGGGGFGGGGSGGGRF